MACAKENNAQRAEMGKAALQGEGTFKYVYKGKYTEGARSGEACVGKVFKTGAVFEDHFFQHEMEVIAKAMELITAFNAAGIIKQKVFLNQPRVWAWQLGTIYSGEKVMVEPLLEDFRKWNSNSGWVAPGDSAWGEAMQALSHFSYHHSNAAFLLCDLQGNADETGMVLTDPAVSSADQRYGPSDLGAKGMSTFFAHHMCNNFCQRHWMRPVRPMATLPCTSGTSMIQSQKVAPAAMRAALKRETVPAAGMAYPPPLPNYSGSSMAPPQPIPAAMRAALKREAVPGNGMAAAPLPYDSFSRMAPPPPVPAAMRAALKREAVPGNGMAGPPPLPYDSGSSMAPPQPVPARGARGAIRAARAREAVPGNGMAASSMAPPPPKFGNRKPAPDGFESLLPSKTAYVPSHFGLAWPAPPMFVDMSKPQKHPLAPPLPSVKEESGVIDLT